MAWVQKSKKEVISLFPLDCRRRLLLAHNSIMFNDVSTSEFNLSWIRVDWRRSIAEDVGVLNHTMCTTSHQ